MYRREKERTKGKGSDDNGWEGKCIGRKRGIIAREMTIKKELVNRKSNIYVQEKKVH